MAKERLLPANLGNISPDEKKLPDTYWYPARMLEQNPGLQTKYDSVSQNKRKEVAKKRYAIHQSQLLKAEKLEDLLREYLEERNTKLPEDARQEIPEHLNLSLKAIDEFRLVVKEAQDFRKVAQQAEDPAEKIMATQFFAIRKAKLTNEFLGPKFRLSFEKAYREYLYAKNDFRKLKGYITEELIYEQKLAEPAFSSIPKDTKIDQLALARIEQVSQTADLQDDLSQTELIDSLKAIFPEESSEYQEMKATLLSNRPKRQTKKEIQEALEQTRKKIEEAFNDPMVGNFYKEYLLNELHQDFAQGKDVIETESVVRYLNLLHDNELQHQDTTIGAIVVGPPGVGKTTILRHYLTLKNRGFVYIDLSEDVTRYMLFGSKSVEFRSQTDAYLHIANTLKNMDNENLENFIKHNSEVVAQVCKLTQDEATVVLLDQINDLLGKKDSDSEKLPSAITDARDRLSGIALRAFHKELASEFSHIVHKNGWRDGMIIAALRRGDCPIFDEFNKNKNWSLIYGLATAKPGKDWYFADNDEWLTIPNEWKMYFSANIGRRHGVFAIPEAFGSRAAGQVIEVTYPTAKEEQQLFMAALSSPEGLILRPEDLGKVHQTVVGLFPEIRKLISDKNQAIPISYRTIRQITEKLILYKDPKTGRPLYMPTDKTFDEALFEVLVESYAIYEEKTIPTEIVSLATVTGGLMLDPKLEDRIVKDEAGTKGYITREQYDEKKEAFEKKGSQLLSEVVKEIRGLQTGEFNYTDHQQLKRNF